DVLRVAPAGVGGALQGYAGGSCSGGRRGSLNDLADRSNRADARGTNACLHHQVLSELRDDSPVWIFYPRATIARGPPRRHDLEDQARHEARVWIRRELLRDALVRQRVLETLDD